MKGVPARWWLACRLLLPLEGTAFQFVDQACDEDEGKEEHGPQEVDPAGHKVPVGQDPGDEEHHADVEKDEEHGRGVELDRVTGLTLGVGRQAAFVGRILDFSRRRLLSEEVARKQYAHTHPDGQDDLQENRKIIDETHGETNRTKTLGRQEYSDVAGIPHGVSRINA